MKVNGSGPLPATVMTIGEAPGADEDASGIPFVGKSGHLHDALLAASGVKRETCRVSNVIKHRPPNNKLESLEHAWWTDKKSKAKKFGCKYFADGMYYNDIVAEGLTEIKQEIKDCQPQVIVAFGNVPLWALTGNLGIANWRGSELVCRDFPSIPVIPTYHPAYVLRVYSWRATVLHDLKVRAFGKHSQDRVPPNYSFHVAQAADAAWGLVMGIKAWVNNHPRTWLSVDVETRYGRIACVGIATTALDAICIPMMHVTGDRYWSDIDERMIAIGIRELLEHPNVLVTGQNFNYDRQYFFRDPLFQFLPRLDFDTMIGQHLLLPGTPKDLSYLSSMYCRFHRYWKEEGKEVEDDVDEDRWWKYNCLDAAVTFEVMQRQRLTLMKAGLL